MSCGREEKPISVGLVGYGTAGSIFHAPLLQSCGGQFEITHVLERTTEKSQRDVPNATIVRSLSELLAIDSIELVVICTPTFLHFQQAKDALLSGKHVVVDKPFTVTSQQAEELIALAATAKKILTVFQNRRFDSDFLTVRSVIDNGICGQLSKVEIHFDRFRPNFKGYWKEKGDVGGGGILFDLGAHLIDQSIQLFGPPTDVVADVQKQREGAEVDDFFRLELSYDSHPGLVVILTGGMLVEELGPKFIVEGSRGCFEKYGEDQQEKMLGNGKRPGDIEWGREPENLWGTFKGKDQVSDTPTELTIQSKNGCYELFYRNLWKAIRCNGQIAVNPNDSSMSVKIIEEAKKQSLM